MSNLLIQLFHRTAGEISRLIPLISSLQIVIATISASFVWGEGISGMKVIGTILMLIGIFLVR